jgi:hypothetical protein
MQLAIGLRMSVARYGSTRCLCMVWYGYREWLGMARNGLEMVRVSKGMVLGMVREWLGNGSMARVGKERL